MSGTKLLSQSSVDIVNGNFSEIPVITMQLHIPLLIPNEMKVFRQILNMLQDYRCIWRQDDPGTLDPKKKGPSCQA